MRQGLAVLTLDCLCQTVVDLCRVYKLQVCHWVLSKEDVAQLLVSDVVSVVQVHVLDVDGFICMGVELSAGCLQPARTHGNAAR